MRISFLTVAATLAFSNAGAAEPTAKKPQVAEKAAAVGKSPLETEEFSFDHQKAVTKAIQVLEDYWKESTTGEAAKAKNNPRKLYDTSKPHFVSKTIKDCDGKSRKLVLVVLPDKTTSGWGFAHLYLEPSGFAKGDSVGGTILSLDETLRMESGDLNCDEP